MAGGPEPIWALTAKAEKANKQICFIIFSEIEILKIVPIATAS